MARPTEDHAVLGSNRVLLAAAAVPAALVAVPILGLAALAAHGSGALWPHLLQYVLPDAALETLLLLSGVGLIAAIVGVATAYLVTAFSFPGRALLAWALLLPLAVPTYIIAYAYADVLHPAGPVQSALRMLLGAGPGALLPEIRSLGGCILLLGFVLYPYVYLNTRAALLMQAADSMEAARGLGASGLVLFRRVALPMIWPAVAVGVGLVMMETLGDIGASEFLGVRTLTVSVYVTWTTRGSIEGAAQIALAMLAVVALLLWAEWRATTLRDREGGGGERRPLRRRLTGLRAAAAFAACALPIGIGFGVPAVHLAISAWLRIAAFGLPAGLGDWVWNSARFALIASLATLAAGSLLAFCWRVTSGRLPALLLRTASLGYALPGTILAVGLLGPLGLADDAVAGVFGRVPSWLYLSGSAAALVLAYMIRFLAIPAGALEAGYARLPAAIDDAALGLGARLWALATRVHGPLLTPALSASAVLVFIECMKELPATLLLRPLNVETLATHIYGEAARGTYEDGAVAALAIVVVGLLPVAMLVRSQRAPVTPRTTALPAPALRS